MTDDWRLSQQDVLDLPLDELAIHVLQDFKESGEWNLHNWVILCQNRHGMRGPALRALGEAIEWLRSHGLVAWDPQQSSSAQSAFVTRRGHEVLAAGLPLLRAIERLDVDLVPELQLRARPHFLRGDFETAAFVAMKEVEVRVRQRADLSDSLIGTRLMQEAFKPPKNESSSPGPLWRDDVDGGEAVALMELFKGAVGLFKNPSSHRRVTFDDPTEAAEIILLADLLLRLLGKIPAPVASPGE